MDAKIITFFNHKGGVSKTTTTYNVGWKLTEKDKRILLVDGDPQCNLTGMVLGDEFDDYYTNEETKNNNIKDAVKVAFEGKPRPIQSIECISPKENDKLFLIPGHMDFSEYEPSLSLALNSNNAITTLQNLPGSFYELIKLCCERYSIDYVLIDMNPGLSAINQTFFMYSDVFLVPTNPDPFSIMALKTLSKVLPRWKKWSIQSSELFEEASYPMPKAKMRFAGEIIQRFNLRNGKAAKPYQGKMEEIQDYIENIFVPELEKVDMLYDITKLKSEQIITSYCISQISEFGALLQKANNNLVPVFALTEEQIHESGTVLANMLHKRDQFDREFEVIAKVILELINNE
ncbi:ParA family protein [Clostridium beijerinckii]|uniref:Chromosome partitioning protein ParA n=1 Tax=Clostridium beijerinckii TaxID=1520 RepID=A0A1S9N3Q0_CLOBE|nr:ParA family protein [Clostridium beijerinckii]OOP72139.1 chromosome partitioning protein ParA [Clostridium beijerinckii]